MFSFLPSEIIVDVLLVLLMCCGRIVLPQYDLLYYILPFSSSECSKIQLSTNVYIPLGLKRQSYLRYLTCTKAFCVLHFKVCVTFSLPYS